MSKLNTEEMYEGLQKAIFIIQTYAPPSDFTLLAINSIRQVQEEHKTLRDFVKENDPGEIEKKLDPVYEDMASMMDEE